MEKDLINFYEFSLGSNLSYILVGRRSAAEAIWVWKTKERQWNKTRSLAIAKRPCDCCVGQFWPHIT